MAHDRREWVPRRLVRDPFEEHVLGVELAEAARPAPEVSRHLTPQPFSSQALPSWLPSPEIWRVRAKFTVSHFHFHFHVSDFCLSPLEEKDGKSMQKSILDAFSIVLLL